MAGNGHPFVLSVGVHDQALVGYRYFAVRVSHVLESAEDEKRGDWVNSRQEQWKVVGRERTDRPPRGFQRVSYPLFSASL